MGLYQKGLFHLGMESNFDHLRLINFARVIRVDDSKETQICLRDKEAFGIYQMYFIHYSVHKTAYKHRVTSAISLMIADALKEANSVIKMPKRDGTMVMMSECIKEKNMDAYLNLTDEVIRQILLNPDPRLEIARQLVRDVWRRKLYMFVIESTPIQSRRFTHEQEDEIRDGILNVLKQKKNSVLRKEHVIIELVNFSFGIEEPHGEHLLLFQSQPNRWETSICRAAK
ncbi:deoxynucleoside triphosphate triphosphohydrolase SAMHD1-like isoform X2 [Pomacea canaliculata]|uniref:deoxynucleoside triphosphate triphosphohydrolase SAMHD1-like isoform X2 n=1 Tax=Pomacea canaliculata TaxID=400727 RepID=UPI000D73F73E|nr:deoxynucleoside triphosphate triphosphohydrolase SAMHD1-like isoform X2 [Pomacea canaliculata]